MVLVGFLVTVPMPFVGKVDDDVFIDIFQIYGYLKAINCSGSCVVGRKIPGAKVVRDPRHKWFVSKMMYPGEYFPTYVVGWAYFLTVEYCKKVTERVRGIRPLHIEDAFVTGIMADSLKATRIFLPPERYSGWGGTATLRLFTAPRARHKLDVWVIILRIGRYFLKRAYKKSLDCYLQDCETR